MNRLMINIMHLLMLSCVRFTEELEKQRWVSPGINIRVRMYLHKKICEHCERYEKEDEQLEKILSEKIKVEGQLYNPDVIEHFKKEIIDKIKREKL